MWLYQYLSHCNSNFRFNNHWQQITHALKLDDFFNLHSGSHVHVSVKLENNSKIVIWITISLFFTCSNICWMGMAIRFLKVVWWRKSQGF